MSVRLRKGQNECDALVMGVSWHVWDLSIIDTVSPPPTHVKWGLALSVTNSPPEETVYDYGGLSVTTQVVLGLGEETPKWSWGMVKAAEE